MTQEALTPLTEAEIKEWRQLLALESSSERQREYLKHHRRVLATIDSLSASLTQAREALKHYACADDCSMAQRSDGQCIVEGMCGKFARAVLSSTPIQDDEYGASLAAQLREKATDG